MAKHLIQLYIYDTDNEVDNRLSHYGGDNSVLRRDIVEGLIDLLDTHNALVQLFRTAREKFKDTHIPNFKVRLYNVVATREYELPTGDMLGAIVYEIGPESDMDYDIVLEERSGHPKRVNKLHPSYVSLQFLLLFIYGEDGYSKDLKMIGPTNSLSEDKRLTMNEYLLGGLGYMYSHYLDALAICRVHGNPSYFITFTCNVNWPEISEYMVQFPLLTTTDRADLVDKLLLAIYAHINVEYCGWTMLIKYLFKYISKGTDRVVAHISRSNPTSIVNDTPSTNRPHIVIDEIKIYLDARYVSPHEACWRIFEFEIHYREPAVQILPVHLQNMQRRRQRIKTKSSIGRLAYVHPAAGDLFYQRMLLCHQTGCTSFPGIHMINNIIYPTCRAACEALGLLQNDREWEVTLQEAALTATPAELRTLLAHIFAYCEVSDPKKLWERTWNTMSEDIPYVCSISLNLPGLHIDDSDLEDYTLYEFETCLNHCSKFVTDFGLRSPPPHLMSVIRNRLLMEEKSYDRQLLATERDKLLPKLNENQR
ncbi:DNA helicase [Tanacetum coccineum]